MQHIVLIGGMGSGKTSIGRYLSSLIKYPHIDLDNAIEQHTQLSIAKIFERYGEQYFRDVETSTLVKAVSCHDPYVISTGGGVVVRKDNGQILKDSGFVVYLECQAHTQMQRVEHSLKRRPLLIQKPNPLNTLIQLQQQREASYRRCANHIIATDEYDIQTLALEIKNAYNAWLKSTT